MGVRGLNLGSHACMGSPFLAETSLSFQSDRSRICSPFSNSWTLHTLQGPDHTSVPLCWCHNLSAQVNCLFFLELCSLSQPVFYLTFLFDHWFIDKTKTIKKQDENLPSGGLQTDISQAWQASQGWKHCLQHASENKRSTRWEQKLG